MAHTEVIVSPALIIKSVCGPFTLISSFRALILVAPFGTGWLQWAIYITLCIESEGVWVYDTVNCSHLSCLEEGRFFSIAHLPLAHPCMLGGSDRWVFLHIGVERQWSTFCLHSHLLSISSAWQGVARNYQGLPELCDQSEGALDLLTLVWQIPAVHHCYLPRLLAVFRIAFCVQYVLYIARYADFLNALYICQNVHYSSEQTARGNTVSNDARCLACAWHVLDTFLFQYDLWIQSNIYFQHLFLDQLFYHSTKRLSPIFTLRLPLPSSYVPSKLIYNY